MKRVVWMDDEMVRVRREREHTNTLQSPCRADGDASRMFREEARMQRGSDLSRIVSKRRHHILAAADLFLKAHDRN